MLQLSKHEHPPYLHKIRAIFVLLIQAIPEDTLHNVNYDITLNEHCTEFPNLEKLIIYIYYANTDNKCGDTEKVLRRVLTNWKV